MGERTTYMHDVESAQQGHGLRHALNAAAAWPREFVIAEIVVPANSKRIERPRTGAPPTPSVSAAVAVKTW